MDTHSAIIQLAIILCTGVFIAWVAWRIKLPSILLLIIIGIILGPYLGFLNTDKLFMHLLEPIISLSVAIILFEGGLSLNMADLKKIGNVVRSLLTVGVLTTWSLVSMAAVYFLDFSIPLAILLGAILVVTGPTVIIPLMRFIRPKGNAAQLLRWEGIVIDPIGVILALIVFEIILIKNPLQASFDTALAILKTAVFGGGLGFLAAWLIIKVFKRNLVPQYLQNAFTLMAVVGVATIANQMQNESGLLAVTVMGIMMASQKEINIDHIVDFKENLQVLLIPAIFIILSSRLDLNDLQLFNLQSLKFLGFIVLVARPVSVLLCTIRSKISWREKIFLCWMAPRGIVAAAMASVFAIQLSHFGYAQADLLVPYVFFVIIGTVAVYGLTSGPLAVLLNLADPNPQGVIIVGAHSWSVSIAKILRDCGIKTLLIDTNPENFHEAKQESLEVMQLNILAEHTADELELSGIGTLIAITSNENVNSMAAIRFAPILGRNKVYQLSSEHKRSYRKKELSSEIRGRILFSSGMTFQYISEKIHDGAQIKSKVLTGDEINSIMDGFAPLVIPLFLVTSGKSMRIFAADNAPKPKEGETLIYLEALPAKTGD